MNKSSKNMNGILLFLAGRLIGEDSFFFFSRFGPWVGQVDEATIIRDMIGILYLGVYTFNGFVT